MWSTSWPNWVSPPGHESRPGLPSRHTTRCSWLGIGFAAPKWCIPFSGVCGSAGSNGWKQGRPSGFDGTPTVENDGAVRVDARHPRSTQRIAHYLPRILVRTFALVRLCDASTRHNGSWSVGMRIAPVGGACQPLSMADAAIHEPDAMRCPVVRQSRMQRGLTLHSRGSIRTDDVIP